MSSLANRLSTKTSSRLLCKSITAVRAWLGPQARAKKTMELCLFSQKCSHMASCSRQSARKVVLTVLVLVSVTAALSASTPIEILSVIRPLKTLSAALLTWLKASSANSRWTSQNFLHSRSSTQCMTPLLRDSFNSLVAALTSKNSSCVSEHLKLPKKIWSMWPRNTWWPQLKKTRPVV